MWRTSMKDELFTMTPDLPGMSPEVVARWQEELRRNALRMKHFSEMIMNPKEQDIGPTPREEIYRKNKSRLYRYQSRRTVKTPLLFVPNLGISRPYIFDLMRKGSFIEHMTEWGFDFFLLDWGVFGPEDNDLTLEHAVTKILPRMARKALEASGAKEISVLGYCMGAPLSLSWIGSTPEFPLKNYVDMPGPLISPRSGSAVSGWTRATSTRTSTSTRWGPSRPTWSRWASSSSSRPWTSRRT